MFLASVILIRRHFSLLRPIGLEADRFPSLDCRPWKTVRFAYLIFNVANATTANITHRM